MIAGVISYKRKIKWQHKLIFGTRNNLVRQFGFKKLKICRKWTFPSLHFWSIYVQGVVPASSPVARDHWRKFELIIRENGDEGSDGKGRKSEATFPSLSFSFPSLAPPIALYARSHHPSPALLACLARLRLGKACGGGRVLYRFYLFWWKWQRWSIRSLTPLSNLLHWHLFAITCCLLRTGKIAIFCIASEGGRSLYFNYEDQEQTQLRGCLNNGDKPIIFNCLWVRGFCDGGFEQQRFWATGSESFSLLICLDAAKFILLKWFYS